MTIFVSFDGAYYNAIYLYTNKLKELIEKIHALPGFRQHYAKKQTKSEGQTNGGVFLWGKLVYIRILDLVKYEHINMN